MPPAGTWPSALDIARALNDRNSIVIQTFNLGLAEYLSGARGVR